MFIILIPLLGAAASFAQSHSVSGTVTDGSSGETLPGVNIKVKGTTTGTSTGAQGQYDLTVKSLQDTLVFSFIGYQTRQVPMNGRTEINIAMQPQAISGQKMVVVGYGEQQEQNLTGPVVEGEELAKSPTQSRWIRLNKIRMLKMNYPAASGGEFNPERLNTNST